MNKLVVLLPSVALVAILVVVVLVSCGHQPAVVPVNLTKVATEPIHNSALPNKEQTNSSVAELNPLFDNNHGTTFGLQSFRVPDSTISEIRRSIRYETIDEVCFMFVGVASGYTEDDELGGRRFYARTSSFGGVIMIPADRTKCQPSAPK